MDRFGRGTWFSGFGSVLKRHYLVIGIAIVAATAIALALAMSSTSIYEAEAQVVVSNSNSNSLFDAGAVVLSDGQTGDAATEAKVIESQAVRDQVVTDLSLAEQPPRPEARAIGVTDVVAVKIRTANPEVSATLANAYATAYIEYRRQQSVDELLSATSEVQSQITELGGVIDELQPDDPSRQLLLEQQAAFQETINELQVDTALKTAGASVIEPAVVPDDAVEPRPWRDALIGLLIGLVVGVAAALIIDRFDRSVRSADELERITGRPVLASVPTSPASVDLPIAAALPDQPAAAAYRELRSRIQLCALDDELNTMLVVGATAGQGATTVAGNLAVVLADADQHVVLVDADLRLPHVQSEFHVPLEPGFVDAVNGKVAAAVTQTVALPSGVTLAVVPAGAATDDPEQVLMSDRVEGVLASLGAADGHGFVIIDGAPTLPVADSLALASRVDGVVLVVDARTARRGDIAEAVKGLDEVGANLIGAVYNNVKASNRVRQYAPYGASPMIDLSNDLDTGDPTGELANVTDDADFAPDEAPTPPAGTPQQSSSTDQPDVWAERK